MNLMSNIMRTEEEGQQIPGSELFKQYREFCLEHELPHCQNTRSFCMKIIPYKGIYFNGIFDKHKGSIMYYSTGRTGK
jgi:hypothetical protein